MSHIISTPDDAKYIELKFLVDFTREKAIQGIIESHTLGRKIEVNRYLVDLRGVRNNASVFTTYEFSYRDLIFHPEFDKAARVVLLVDADDHSHDFSETVLRNAGMNVRLFRDRDLAVQHLLNIEPPHR